MTLHVLNSKRPEKSVQGKLLYLLLKIKQKKQNVKLKLLHSAESKSISNQTIFPKTNGKMLRKVVIVNFFKLNELK